jgi:hypothetical protein
VHLVARPALGFLLRIPFRTEVHAVFIIGSVYQNDALASFQFGKLQTGCFWIDTCEILVLVFCDAGNFGIILILAARKKASAR